MSFLRIRKSETFILDSHRPFTCSTLLNYEIFRLNSSLYIFFADTVLHFSR